MNEIPLVDLRRLFSEKSSEVIGLYKHRPISVEEISYNDSGEELSVTTECLIDDLI